MRRVSSTVNNLRNAVSGLDVEGGGIFAGILSNDVKSNKNGDKK